jgi:serine phosphatase RsbU (regulator of sigma subunit)
VGGDCFDVRQLSPDAWAAVVTDVSGKGVSSALLAALVQGSFVTGSPDSIEETMSRINAFLYERTEGEKYATVFYCMLHRDGTLTWSNAGHVTPFLLRSSGDIQVLDSTGMPIGMLDTATFAIDTLQLEGGDKIVAFSDGLTEAQDAQGRFFDTRHLRELIAAHAGATAAELHSAIMAEIENFATATVQTDDITALVLEYRP